MAAPRLTITAPRTDADLDTGRRIWQWLRQKKIDAHFDFDGATVRVSMPYRNEHDLQYGLDASTAWSVESMQLHPLPLLYEAGVHYAREPMCRTDGVERMCEEFVTAPEVLRRGFGDCDDLGCYRAAELRMQGEKANAFARRSPAGWHVVVRRADGSIEDPSARLGMPTS